MKIRLRTYIEATWTFLRAVHNHGLKETSERVEQIGKQSDFWFKECERLHAAAITAYEQGDIEAYNAFYRKHAIALQRFIREVQQPLNELAGR